MEGLCEECGLGLPGSRRPVPVLAGQAGDNKSQPTISAEEKVAAKADIECKRSTRFLGTWLAADLAYQKLLIQRGSIKLDEYNKNQTAMLAKVNEIIAKG